MNKYCMTCGHSRHEGECSQPFVSEWLTFTAEQRRFISTLQDHDFKLLAELGKEKKVITFLAYADAIQLAYFTHFGFAQTLLGKYNQLVWEITTFGEKALKFQ